jgi:L-ascorbate metabolism protein UlaG (beta-lactamase superfamily)
MKIDQTLPYLRKHKLIVTLLIIGGFITMRLNSLNAVTMESENYSSTVENFSNGKFVNSKTMQEFSFSKVLKMLKRSLFDNKNQTTPLKPIPVEMLNTNKLLSLPSQHTSIVRLGHSTLLIKLEDKFWLIDPVFSERASPFSFMGPKRFHQSPISIEDLPNIEAVIISHNHYDHLDEQAIKKLKSKTNHFVVPLGNGAQLESWGVESSVITELNWWQNVNIGNVELISIPAQHFSGRGLSDKNKALWSSWVIRTENSSIFFSGDSGYFDGFKKIGNRYGPFDMTLIESGAYDHQWSDVHMTPSESAQAHKDLKGRKMFPIHNGTFNLAFHAWTEPFEQLTEIVNIEWIDLLTPKMGQVVTLEDDDSVDAARDLFWWRES